MDNDYIKTLSNEEKLIFLKIFCCLIRADSNIDAEEITFLCKSIIMELTSKHLIKLRKSIMWKKLEK